MERRRRSQIHDKYKTDLTIDIDFEGARKKAFGINDSNDSSFKKRDRSIDNELLNNEFIDHEEISDENDNIGILRRATQSISLDEIQRRIDKNNSNTTKISPIGNIPANRPITGEKDLLKEKTEKLHTIISNLKETEEKAKKILDNDFNFSDEQSTEEILNEISRKTDSFLLNTESYEQLSTNEEKKIAHIEKSREHFRQELAKQKSSNISKVNIFLGISLAFLLILLGFLVYKLYA